MMVSLTAWTDSGMNGRAGVRTPTSKTNHYSVPKMKFQQDFQSVVSLYKLISCRCLVLSPVISINTVPCFFAIQLYSKANNSSRISILSFHLTNKQISCRSVWYLPPPSQSTQYLVFFAIQLYSKVSNNGPPSYLPTGVGNTA